VIDMTANASQHAEHWPACLQSFRLDNAKESTQHAPFSFVQNSFLLNIGCMHWFRGNCEQSRMNLIMHAATEAFQHISAPPVMIVI
jgi:hypothetical protein